MSQCGCARRWLIQDALKVLTYWLLYRYDVFQVRSQAEGKARRPGDEHLLGIQVRPPGARAL